MDVLNEASVRNYLLEITMFFVSVFFGIHSPAIIRIEIVWKSIYPLNTTYNNE